MLIEGDAWSWPAMADISLKTWELCEESFHTYRLPFPLAGRWCVPSLPDVNWGEAGEAEIMI